ncbi:MAG TPA: hypothetical protein VFS21_30545 [Roseiflexaceae bacterium]|nr:hypothetical protein [Roseiflexaceae bacterium]
MATYHTTMPTAVSDTPGDRIPRPAPQAPAALLAVAAQLREEALRIRRVSDALAQRPLSESGEGRALYSAQARLARLRDLQEQSHLLHEQIAALVAVLEGQFGHA